MSISTLFADGNKPNILMIITDQERSIAEWPASYQTTLADMLPAMQKLAANGLSFDNFYTAACMCSPSRSAFLTSQYPIVTGCTTTGASVLPAPTDFPNLATVLSKAGYGCYWIGKWHLLANEPGDGADDLAQWGFQSYQAGPNTLAWDYPDAGITLNNTRLGGGPQGTALNNGNDLRYVADAQAFLQTPPQEPWFLVVSLVNPHDVHLGYLAEDGSYYDQSAYQDYAVPLPGDVDENPADMPRGQAYTSWKAFAAPTASQQDFANFYAYLTQYIDGQIDSILTGMSDTLIQDTLIIRFADHGEMGLSHGLVEKFVNAYGECVHVPLIFSNPVAYPAAQSTAALASSVDLAPTLAALLGVGGDFPDFVGTDLSPVLNDPTQSVQDYVHFTYDDLSGTGPSVIRGIRTAEWAYSVYLVGVENQPGAYADADWEMYDLTADPTEDQNIAGQGLSEQATLDQALQDQMQQKGTAPAWYPTHWPPQATANSRGGPPPGDAVQIRYPVDRIPGIDPAQARDLIYVGVPDTAALVARTATPAGRQTLASLVPVGASMLESWIGKAGLLQIDGLGLAALETLTEAGIDSPAALAALAGTAPPAALQVDPALLDRWIAAARTVS